MKLFERWTALECGLGALALLVTLGVLAQLLAGCRPEPTPTPSQTPRPLQTGRQVAEVSEDVNTDTAVSWAEARERGCTCSWLKGFGVGDVAEEWTEKITSVDSGCPLHEVER